MLKNTAGQKIGAQMLDLDGVAFTGSVTVYVCGDAGTQAAGSVGSGACTHEGNGYHTYAPSQAETNFDLIAFTFVGTGAIPATVQVMTVSELWTASAARTAIGLASANLDTQLSTLAGYVDTEVAAIKAKTDNLPANPAAVGSAMTLTSDYDAAKTAASQTSVNAIPTAPLLAVNYIAPPSVSAIRTEMDANSTKLASLDAAIAALHDFDPATDTVAHVTLVDTATTLTNAPAVPTEAEIADAVRTELTPELAAVLAMETRMAEQVPTGPVVVLPAPAAGQTIAWVMCYGPTGAIESGVTISIFLTKTTEDGAFDAAAAVLTSDEDGLAQGPIPRGAGHTFKARRGTNGKLYAFAGVDAESLALPSLLGSP